ncbi:MAG TPA: hypothetical protein VF223_11910 [Trebonia sp.]
MVAAIVVITPAVELNDKAVLVVKPVAKSLRAVRLGEWNLSARWRQAVGTLDIPVVTVLERRVGAACRHRDNLVEKSTPAESLSRVHRPPEIPLAGEVSLKGASDPANRVVKIHGRVYEIQDGFLDQGVRRHTACEPPSLLHMG